MILCVVLAKMVNEVDFYYVLAEKQWVMMFTCYQLNHNVSANINTLNITFNCRTMLKHFLKFKIYLEDQYFYFYHNLIALDQ